jgi:hypothetical protein
MAAAVSGEDTPLLLSPINGSSRPWDVRVQQGGEEVQGPRRADVQSSIVQSPMVRVRTKWSMVVFYMALCALVGSLFTTLPHLWSDSLHWGLILIVCFPLVFSGCAVVMFAMFACGNTKLKVENIFAPKGAIIVPPEKGSVWRMNMSGMDGTRSYLQPDIVMLLLVVTALLGALPFVSVATLAAIGDNKICGRVWQGHTCADSSRPQHCGVNTDWPTQVSHGGAVVVPIISIVAFLLRAARVHTGASDTTDVFMATCNPPNGRGLTHDASRSIVDRVEKNALRKEVDRTPERMLSNYLRKHGSAIAFSAVSTVALLPVHIFSVDLNVTSGRFCARIEPSVYVHDHPITRGGYMAYCVLLTFVAGIFLFKTWFCHLPSGPVVRRLKLLTEELNNAIKGPRPRRVSWPPVGGVKVARIADHDNEGLVLRRLLQQLEAWFDARRTVMARVNDPQYRQIELCLLGDVLAVSTIIIFFLVRTVIPNIVNGTSWLGGASGWCAFFSISVMVYGLVIIAVAMRSHSWDIIYGHASETARQQAIFDELQCQLMCGTAQFDGNNFSERHLIPTFTYLSRVHQRLESAVSEQPKIFGVQVQPTLKNAILASAASLVIAVAIAVFHKVF